MKASFVHWPCVPALFVLAACARVAPPDSAPVPATVMSEWPTASVVQTGAAVAGIETDSQPQLRPDELDMRTAELFGDALRIASARPVPPDSAAPRGEVEPSWDIDVRSYETVDRVRFYVSRFSGSARERIEARLSVGTRYESMIRAKLRQGGLPEDMYYLALVESGFDPHAYSRAAAVGMWQFMTTTARGVGLRVDWWVDERRDPVRSTDAAVRFLGALNEQFGSMYLAAAAYNGGPGRIARGLSRYEDDLEGIEGDDMFFALAKKKYLKNETREYVPQLIAAALVAKEPLRYGLSIENHQPFAYDSVMVGPRVPLAAIAAASGATLAVVQELNSHILRGMTPPRDSMKVRIPVGTRSRFEADFASVPNESRTFGHVVTAKKGATWASLARGEPISARVLAIYNPKVKPAKSTGRIAAGTTVLVPSAAVVAAALPVPDPSVERYGSGSRTHVVRRGENLGVIAKRYGTSPAAIMRLNRLKKPLILPGQELLVKGRAPTSARAKRSEPSSPKSSKPTMKRVTTLNR